MERDVEEWSSAQLIQESQGEGPGHRALPRPDCLWINSLAANEERFALFRNANTRVPLLEVTYFLICYLKVAHDAI